MNGVSRLDWASLPSDALAYIINECGLCQSDVASVRLVCVHWRSTTNSHLKSLAPACTSLEQVAGIAQRFPYLTNCDLTRCDTRLVGHASLCRDASARLSTLLAALSRMPSLTSLHISDTFSERMGQKHWASLVCAQALVDVSPPPSVALPASVEPAPTAPTAPQSSATSAAETAIGAEAGTEAAGGTHPVPAAAHCSNAPSDAVDITQVDEAGAGSAPGASTAACCPFLLDSDGNVTAADTLDSPVSLVAAEAEAEANPASALRDRSTHGAPAPSSAPPAPSRGMSSCSCGAAEGGPVATAAAATTTTPSRGSEGGEREGGRAAYGAARDDGVRLGGGAAALEAVSGGEGEEGEEGEGEEGHVAHPDVGVDPAGARGPDVETARAGNALDGADPTVWALVAAELELEAAEEVEAEAEPAPPPPPPPPLVLSAAELADPGIKSFARAISRPGATQQHAFWLPDWCGRLAGLQELHIRGRQRPSTGLPPCLLWLHAGRTAPQLTSLSLVRLSLVTLPEQLQHLTALTRLVAQDCSLSLMPRGLAGGLSRLEYMDLSLNGLTSLPPDFTQLTALRHLDLQRNKLASLPADIGRLSLVSCLLLNNNQLRQLPASLSSLRHVEELSCSYNWLGGMGPSLPLLCSLPRLRRLELACVSDVRCRLVPPQELRLLAGHLTHLDLAANNLVPADVLGTLTSVRSLVLSDCGLLAVPPWVRRLAQVTHLDLSNNSLSELPTWLSTCARLRYLSIAHNRLSIRVPPAVMEQMPQLEVVESE